MATEPSLTKLRKEIDSLKKQKERKMALATSMQEKEKLLREIQELEMVKQNPSMLRNVGKDFKKGLKTVGKTFWRGITTASRNLNQNSPEYRNLGKTMSKPQTKPISPMTGMYGYYETTRIPKKVKKGLKKKDKKKKARRMVYNQPKTNNRNMWELP